MASWETARQRCSGNGSPQMPVKPELNMEEANRMLTDYKGGHSNFPVAQGIVDCFVKDYKSSHEGEQYSAHETDFDNESGRTNDDSKQERNEVKNSDRYSPEVLFAKDPLAVAIFPVQDVPTKRKKVNLPEIVKEAKRGTDDIYETHLNHGA